MSTEIDDVTKPIANVQDTDSKRELTCSEIVGEEIGKLKWRVLIFIMMLTFGDYYIYDFPGSIGTGPKATIQHYFKDHGKEYTQTMNQALYSVYSYPNTVLCIFGGLLIDKFLGLRRAIILFASFLLMGSILFWIGVSTRLYPIMLLARVVYGLGAESLNVAQSTYLSRWFKNGRGMALAFGITLSFARVGSSFNFLFSPMIAEKLSVQTATLFGVFACCLSFAVAICLVIFDVYGEKHGHVPKESKDASEPFHFSQIKQVTLMMWILWFVCVFAYCSVFPFIAIAKNFFQVKFDYSGPEASRYVSMYQFTCAAGSPMVGLAVDALGRFTYFISSSCFLFGGIHMLFLLTMIRPYLLMPSMGLVYSLMAASLWPAVPYAIDDSLVGVAFGFMTSLQNIGLATFPLITGSILDYYTPANSTNTTNTTNLTYWLRDENGDDDDDSALPELQGYKVTQWIFIGISVLGGLLALWVLYLDKSTHGLLSLSAKDRKAVEAERKRLIQGEQGDAKKI